jgi:hypothetical protein
MPSSIPRTPSVYPWCSLPSLRQHSRMRSLRHSKLRICSIRKSSQNMLRPVEVLLWFAWLLARSLFALTWEMPERWCRAMANTMICLLIIKHRAKMNRNASKDKEDILCLVECLANWRSREHSVTLNANKSLLLMRKRKRPQYKTSWWMNLRLEWRHWTLSQTISWYWQVMAYLIGSHQKSALSSQTSTSWSRAVWRSKTPNSSLES